MIENHLRLPPRANRPARRLVLSVCALALAALTGCAGNLTGLVGAQEDFGCPASGGVNCTTVSATYEREHAAAEPASGRRLTDVAESSLVSAASLKTGEKERIRVSSEPLEKAPQQPQAMKTDAFDRDSRLPERVVMLWILPWVDAAGDLHSDSRVWMRVRDAAWRIESVRTRAMRSAPRTQP